MRSLLSQLVGSSRIPLTVVVMDGDQMGRPVQHEVQPRAVLAGLALGALALALTVLALVFFTPVRMLVPGYGAGHAGAEGQAEAVRLAALEDSLRVQQEYVARFRALLSGKPAPLSHEEAEEATPPPRAQARPVAPPVVSPEPPRGSGAVAAVWTGEPTARLRPVDAAGLPLPAPSPVQGFLTRGFDARTGHFGVDVATGTGSVVRTVGDGFVIFADWTFEGGNTLAVQHADGYVSVYKHNERLLRRTGERVRARDAVAVSGNTGEVSTGPHLHFELWRDGLPQDPRAFVVGW